MAWKKAKVEISEAEEFRELRKISVRGLARRGQWSRRHRLGKPKAVWK
jgi:hypothetical protein